MVMGGSRMNRILSVKGHGATMMQIWSVVAGGIIAIVSSAVTSLLTHVLTTRRERELTSQEYRRKSLLELRGALLEACSAADEFFSYGQPAVGGSVEAPRAAFIRANTGLATAQTLSQCVDDVVLRESAESMIKTLRGYMRVPTPDQATRHALDERFNVDFQKFSTEIGRCLRDNVAGRPAGVARSFLRWRP